MSNIYFKVGASAGIDTRVAIAEAIDLAKKHNIRIQLDVNGITIYLTTDSNVEQGYQLYLKEKENMSPYFIADRSAPRPEPWDYE